MADSPIGISFMPTADAAANGPRQASIEGQGGSDLAAAFKILSLHLPRVLGAASIAPKRLLTSPGAAGIGGPAGANPYAQVFQALLQSISGGMPMGGGDVASLSSLFGGGGPNASDLGGIDLGGGMTGGSAGGYTPSGTPPPAVIPGSDLPRSGDLGTPPPPAAASWAPEDRTGGNTYSNRYL